ncbi:MAG: single-stranded-DNA-specific exonuclease RecJ [Opitutales bacterium]|nr:single-stranded-DNA-specific exonuclease RecJ [Opitutales bacterium]
MSERREVEWKFLDADSAVVERLSQKLGVSKILASILVQRGVATVPEAERFIAPKISDLGDPFLLPNMREAVALLDRYVAQKAPISIIGDYDVDGITSTALLVSILAHFGIHPQYFIPRRFSEGYGMSQEIVNRMLKKSCPKLVIALDCGTNSIKEINFLQRRRIDVLVIDHHMLTVERVPEHATILNPHTVESSATLRAMCTVGLVFKFVHAFLKQRRIQGDERAFSIRLRNYFDIIALGTIADMMPVRGENRVLVKYGLQSFAKERRPGLDALCSVSNIPSGTSITQQDVSFKLAPRINVSGRLSDAALPVELLLSSRISDAMLIAKKVDKLNRERQKIEHEITLEAEKIVSESYRDDPGIVLYSPHWHSGVVGIVAGKLSREYERPVIVLALERGLAKGSGRSPGPDLVEILSECREYVAAWGGHKMAVGISLEPEQVEIFRQKFNEAIAKRKTEGTRGETIEVAGTLQKNEIDDALAYELETFLQPYGQQNEEPIFCIKRVRFLNCTEFFGAEKKHFRFWIESSPHVWLSGIAWDMASRFPEKNRDIDILVKIAYDTWNNEKFLLMRLVDWRYSEKS